MVGEHFSRTQQKWACVQFIAEVSLIANCKPSDFKARAHSHCRLSKQRK